METNTSNSYSAQYGSRKVTFIERPAQKHNTPKMMTPRPQQLPPLVPASSSQTPNTRTVQSSDIVRVGSQDIEHGISNQSNTIVQSGLSQQTVVSVGQSPMENITVQYPLQEYRLPQFDTRNNMKSCNEEKCVKISIVIFLIMFVIGFIAYIITSTK
jgi:hypothetical protein